MIGFIQNSLDWLPLVGGLGFGWKVLFVWAVILLGTLAIYWLYSGCVVTALKAFLLLSVLCFTVSFIAALSSLEYEAEADKPAPVPASTTPIEGADRMDKERIEVRGEDSMTATVVLYGERQDDAFRVEGYRARVTGSDAWTEAAWDISLPSSYRYNGFGISSDTPIRADGQWQWGEVTQKGIFSSGQSYEFIFDFDIDSWEWYEGFPVSF